MATAEGELKEQYQMVSEKLNDICKKLTAAQFLFGVFAPTADLAGVVIPSSAPSSLIPRQQPAWNNWSTLREAIWEQSIKDADAAERDYFIETKTRLSPLNRDKKPILNQNTGALHRYSLTTKT